MVIPKKEYTLEHKKKSNPRLPHWRDRKIL